MADLVKETVIRQIKQTLKDTLDSAPKVMGLSTIVNEGEQGILKVISLKADRNELEKLHELKTNREDTENLFEILMEFNQML